MVAASVRIIAAESINQEAHYQPWLSLRKAINHTMKQKGWSQVDKAHIGLVTGYGDMSDGSVVILHN